MRILKYIGVLLQSHGKDMDLIMSQKKILDSGNIRGQRNKMGEILTTLTLVRKMVNMQGDYLFINDKANQGCCY